MPTFPNPRNDCLFCELSARSYVITSYQYSRLLRIYHKRAVSGPITRTSALCPARSRHTQSPVRGAWYDSGLTLCFP